MSRFFSAKYTNLVPCVPSHPALDQPEADEREYLKLDSEIMPFPPSSKAAEYAAAAALHAGFFVSRQAGFSGSLKEWVSGSLRSFDNEEPDAGDKTTALARRMPYGADDANIRDLLCRKYASMHELSPDEVLVTNGAGAALNLAMMSFCDRYHPAAAPDITNGMYRVLAELNGVPLKEIPLLRTGGRALAVRPDDYIALGRTIFLSNPNTPTGIALTPDEIEGILRVNSDNAVIIDETYAGFGAQTCLPLVRDYWNLVVVRSMTVTHALPGAGIGFAAGCAEIIDDLRTVSLAMDPHGVSSISAAAALGALDDEQHTRFLSGMVVQNREFLAEGLRGMGFELTESSANFVLARHPNKSGEELCKGLAKRRILPLGFDTPEILAPYIRITAGTRGQMQIVLEAMKEIFG